MDFGQLQQYVVPALLVGFFGWRFVRFRLVKRQIPELIKGGAVIVDVRSRGEFASGSSEGSINIPLDELKSGSDTLNRSKPVVVCCASGTRSAMAASVLRRKGFVKVVNAGPWRNTVN
jgi:phage shock protein E